ncbi:unnamed protein product [Schistosoma haematobium]|nr:unnamed protein product [Schistosoma haematobium]
MAQRLSINYRLTQDSINYSHCSYFLYTRIATAIGTHLLTFLNGCFLDIGNLKKLIFPG